MLHIVTHDYTSLHYGKIIVTQLLSSDHAWFTQRLRSYYAKIMQYLRIDYAMITQCLLNLYAMITMFHNQDDEFIPDFSDYILLLQFIRHTTEIKKQIHY